VKQENRIGERHLMPSFRNKKIINTWEINSPVGRYFATKQRRLNKSISNDVDVRLPDKS
jgi:hypothetical protein